MHSGNFIRKQEPIEILLSIKIQNCGCEPIQTPLYLERGISHTKATGILHTEIIREIKKEKITPLKIRTRNSKHLIWHLGDSGFHGGGHLGFHIRTNNKKNIYFVKNHQMNIPTKFGLNWLCSFGTKDQNVKTFKTTLKW